MSNQHICMLAVIITSVFKEENYLRLDDLELHRSRQYWTAKAATRWPEIHHTQASWTTCNRSCCMQYKFMQFSRYVAIYLSRIHAATIYSYSYKGMLSKYIPLVARAWCNRVVPYVIAILKNYSYSVCVVYMHVNDETWPSISCVVGGHFTGSRKASVK